MDIKGVIAEAEGKNYQLHSAYLNPVFAKILKIIGFDVVYVRGEGAYLYDQTGRKYLDFLAGYGVFNMGRNHPRVRQVLEDLLQLNRPNLVQMDCPLLAGLLAQRLLAFAHRSYPDLEAVFFTNSGAEAVEGALKFARAATGKTRFLYLEHAFHGLTLGALSVNGSEHFRAGFGELLPATQIPLGDLGALERELRAGDVACLIVEPIQGKGVYLPGGEFLRGAQRLCRQYGALFIVDEIQAGLGRAGRPFAGEHWGLEPDIVTVSKALSGGYVPVGAILTRREIHRRVFSSLERAVVHSNTFGMNELAMGAGLAALAVLEEEKLPQRAAELGDYFVAGLNRLKENCDLILDVRGKGLMIGIEFGPPKSRVLRGAWQTLEKVQQGLFAQLVVMALLRDHALLTQVSAHRVNIVKFLPPLVIEKEDVDWALTALEEVLREAQRFPGGIWKWGKELVRGALAR